MKTIENKKKSALLVLAACLVVACSGSSPKDDTGLALSDAAFVDHSGQDLDGQAEVPDWQEAPDESPPDGNTCWPERAYGCSVDGQGLQICLPDGSGYDVVPCETQDGRPGRCLAGRCTRCIPGERFCRDEDHADQCDDTGMHTTLLMDCNGAVTGQICVAGSCKRLCELAEKWASYMGCDYWGADLDNAYLPGEASDAQGAPYAIVVSNPHERFPAEVSILRWDEASGAEEIVPGAPFDLDNGESDPAKPFATEPLEPGGLRVYYLPRRDVNGTTKAPLAYHVESSIPITAYQFNPLENVDVKSNDASLLLPSNVLGSYYRVMAREQTYGYLRGYLTVIAVSGGETEVSVTVTAPTLAGEIPHLEPGDSTGIVRLQRYDVLNIETDAPGADMTGSLVLSSKPVAVFGGVECANVPNTELCGADGLCEWDGETPCQSHEDCFAFITGFCDHLEQQMWPVSAWGKRYLCGRSMERATESDVWRVLASEDQTRVTTLPPQGDFPVLDAGEWLEFESDEHFELIAEKPVMVAQFLAGQDAPTPGKVSEPDDANIGDPAFLVLVPAEQFREDYVFLAPDKYELDYVTIHAPAESVVLLDGEEIPADAWVSYGTGEWRVIRLSIADGIHRVTADAPVGVYVYGYDFHVSYGYPAGLDLKNINDAPFEWPY